MLVHVHILHLNALGLKAAMAKATKTTSRPIHVGHMAYTQAPTACVKIIFINNLHVPSKYNNWLNVYQFVATLFLIVIQIHAGCELYKC